MKKFIYFVFVSIIIVIISFGIYQNSNKYNLNILYKSIDWSINTKGCDKARSFDFDDKGNLYIAYDDSIKIISADNKENKIVKRSGLNIYDIAIRDNSIIIASGNAVLQYDTDNDVWVDLITDMPNTGVNKAVKLLVKNNDIYVAIGSNTNAGVVDEPGGAYDKASFHWELTGASFGAGDTGGFLPYGTAAALGTEIKEEVLSNAVIIKYDCAAQKVSNYATGIRNIKGLDYTSDGKIIGITGGIESYGARGIDNDSDYIYEIKENGWYGWPDFSGGDLINSPRFISEDKNRELLIKNHPVEVVYGPIYQHKSVSSLNGLAIDKEGKCIQKDTVIFADNNEKYLYAMTKEGIANVIVELSDTTIVETIRYYNGAFYVLDSGMGCIYILEGKDANTTFSLPKSIWAFSIIFLIVLIISMVFKVKGKEIKKN